MVFFNLVNLFDNLDGFKMFPRLKILHLACNNIKTLYLKHDDFGHLEVNDCFFNADITLILIFIIKIQELRFIVQQLEFK